MLQLRRAGGATTLVRPGATENHVLGDELWGQVQAAPVGCMACKPSRPLPRSLPNIPSSNPPSPKMSNDISAVRRNAEFRISWFQY